MKLSLLPVAAILLAAPAAQATAPRFYAFDPADAATRSRTGGVTVEAVRGLFGGNRVVRIYATTNRGSVGVDGAPGDERRVLGVLPPEARETNVYAFQTEGPANRNGAALMRALCPGSTRAWFVLGRLRPLEDLTLRVVGQSGGNPPVFCTSLNYRYRGEWSDPLHQTPQAPVH